MHVDDMARRERKLHTTPKLVVLVDGVRIVVEDAKKPVTHSFSNNDPHAFNGDRLLLVIH